MPTINLDNTLIHYLAAGANGSPVILLHGGGTDSAALSWSATIPASADAHRVFAPDWPGYGESGDAHVPYTVDFYVETLARFMDALSIPRASLVGISMGGSVALGFALRYTHRVDRLVPVDSYGLADRAPSHFLSWLFIRLPLVNALSWALVRRSRAMARWSLTNVFHDVKNAPEDLIDAVFADVQSPRAGKAFESFQKHEMLRMRLRTVYLERLQEITAPTLIVHGANDKLVPLAAAQEAARRIAGARLHVIPECGHWPQREKPADFNRVVGEFLTG